MTNHTQMVHVPALFRIGRSIPAQLPLMLRSAGIEVASILVLTGREYSRRVAEDLVGHLGAATLVRYTCVGEASHETVERVADEARQLGATLLLSVGGGTVIDVGKRIQRLHGIPNFVFPTVISNDGLTSPISVLADARGQRESFPAAVPFGVAVDLDLIGRSPKAYLVAAAGDVLSNLSASMDWARLFREAAGHFEFNDLAYELAVGAAETLLGSRAVDFTDDLFLTSVVRAQVYSGIAMGLAGTSRPCSGAEHLLSHAIDHLGLGGRLHGIQVGSISLFTLSLLGSTGGPAVDFARRIGLPLDWRRLSPGVEDGVDAIVATSRTVRPDRRTILDHYTDAELIAEAAAFSGVVQRLA